ncbi:hypothetical protein [Acinetobacter silvestris]|uniref:Uncharacterized protein n=1 Tax=Acinetobacter silvestris TaxID=1977882 RepID=A0A1Y3CFD2_9GAMM|nr:hypothetical protein [Acinetobacter silvestris]OTG63873.1 hypothetical protein B9T28_12875 [Acinetobacter silvestris]
MRISLLFIFFCSSVLNAEVPPKDFYMKETYNKFLKEDMGDTYYIEKRINNNFVAVIEEYSKKNNKLIKKNESVYINPIVLKSYNDYYQITKTSDYENGKISSTSYSVGNSNNCFVKCGVEVFYKDSKVLKKIKYPSCLSLLNMETRKLDYKNSYVEKNCIPN